MRVALVSANLGRTEPPPAHAHQHGVDLVQLHFTDENFPPRTRSMTPRLQAKIPKMFAWQMAPGFDAYIWLDATFTLLREDAALWFLDQLGQNEIAVFRHPNRSTIQEEAAQIRKKLAQRDAYHVSRYAGELLNEQVDAILSDPTYTDDHLFAAGAFVYRPTTRLRNMMKEWWYHTSRYHVIDQIAFPYAIHASGVVPVVIPDDIYRCAYFCMPHVTTPIRLVPKPR